MTPRWLVSAALAIAALGGGSVQAQEIGVREALFAEVGGLGGCAAAPEPRRLPTLEAFFSDVRFYEGTCFREHGDTEYGLVAVDTNGQVFVLRSLVGYRFLSLRHPPTKVTAETALDFAQLALLMTGHRRPEAALLTPESTLGSTLAQAVRSNQIVVSRPRVEQVVGGYDVFLTLGGDEWATWFLVRLRLNPWELTVIPQPLWPPQAR